MSVKTELYKPLLFSEREAPDVNGQLDKCRAASFAMIFDAGTNGDWTTNRDGTKWGRAKIRKAQERMVAKVGNRDGYNQSHMDEFAAGIGVPANVWQMRNVQFWHIIKDLQDKTHCYELAGDVKHTPVGSPLRTYVNPNVGHDIALVAINRALTKIAFIDPMTPHGTRKYIRWAPVEHFKKFASEFAVDGKVVAGRVRRGWWSDEAIARRKHAALVLKLQMDLLALQKEWKKQQNELSDQDEQITALGLEIARLRVELETCGGADGAPLLVELDKMDTSITKMRDVLH